MNQRLTLSTILAVSLVAGCTSTLHKTTTQQKSLKTMHYESMDHQGRHAHMRTLKREILTCSGKSHCADMHYQIAVFYLSDPEPTRNVLDSAHAHLEKSSLHDDRKAHVEVLRKVLRGWIVTVDQHSELEKKVRVLEANIERARAIDLETIKE